jgi:hypothetical protein
MTGCLDTRVEKEICVLPGAPIADFADYVMLHKEERRRFSMTMNRPQVGAWVAGYSRSDLTGVHIVRRCLEVFRGVHVGCKHLSGNRKARIVDYSGSRNMEVLRCLPIY